MKQYAVLRATAVFSPSVVFESNDYEDAMTYAQIVSKNDKYEYVVVKCLNSFKTVED